MVRNPGTGGIWKHWILYSCRAEVTFVQIINILQNKRLVMRRVRNCQCIAGLLVKNKVINERIVQKKIVSTKAGYCNLNYINCVKNLAMSTMQYNKIVIFTRNIINIMIFFLNPNLSRNCISSCQCGNWTRIFTVSIFVRENLSGILRSSDGI